MRKEEGVAITVLAQQVVYNKLGQNGFAGSWTSTQPEVL
jgi:hypothetical protein